MIMDARFGTILEAENADVVLPMASTTKVMTALVVLEQVKLYDRVKIPKEAAGVEGSSLYMKAEDEYTVEELLYGLMLRSANDCAEALAVYAGGGDRAHFIDLMNQKAKELGLLNTCFKNPSGLPEEGHYTTAHELALIMRAAMKNPTFCQITGTKSKIIKDQRIINHNKLLSLYAYCYGGKTGYTMAAGRCLVSVAQKEGVPLICVTLNRRGDWDLHIGAYEKWFGSFEKVVLEQAGCFHIDLQKAGGGKVAAYNSNLVCANLFPDSGEVERIVLAPHFLYGDQKAGDVVGMVEYRIGGFLIGESALVLRSDITEPVKKELFISRIFRFFRQLFLKKG